MSDGVYIVLSVALELMIGVLVVGYLWAVYQALRCTCNEPPTSGVELSVVSRRAA